MASGARRQRAVILLDYLARHPNTVTSVDTLASQTGASYGTTLQDIAFIKDEAAEIEGVSLVTYRGSYGGVKLTKSTSEAASYAKSRAHTARVIINRALTGCINQMIKHAPKGTKKQMEDIQVALTRVVEDLERLEKYL